MQKFHRLTASRRRQCSCKVNDRRETAADAGSIGHVADAASVSNFISAAHLIRLRLRLAVKRFMLKNLCMGA